MTPTPKSPPELALLLAFGAHPDDIEFACGGVIALETRAGRPVHLAVCSRGESSTHGSPDQREAEARKAAVLLGAALQFLELDGDARLEMRAAHAIKLAEVIRRVRPAIVLAPSVVENQHPDHWRLGRLVRDATRLARYGGVTELQSLPPHVIGQLFFYALAPESEPADISPLLIDHSAPEVMQAWTSSMEAHGSQTSARNYVEYQLARSRLHGMRAGVPYATPLFPGDPPVLDSLSPVARGARKF